MRKANLMGDLMGWAAWPAGFSVAQFGDTPYWWSTPLAVLLAGCHLMLIVCNHLWACRSDDWHRSMTEHDPGEPADG